MFVVDYNGGVLCLGRGEIGSRWARPPRNRSKKGGFAVLMFLILSEVTAIMLNFAALLEGIAHWANALFHHETFIFF